MIQLRELYLRRGTKSLLEGANLTVHPGQKVGLIGANGTGKSSLFALFRGLLHADRGDAQWPAGWVLAHVAQETPAVTTSALEYALQGDAELIALEAQLADAEAQHDVARGVVPHHVAWQRRTDAPFLRLPRRHAAVALPGQPGRAVACPVALAVIPLHGLAVAVGEVGRHARRGAGALAAMVAWAGLHYLLAAITLPKDMAAALRQTEMEAAGA